MSDKSTCVSLIFISCVIYLVNSADIGNMEKEQIVPDVIDKVPKEVVKVSYSRGVNVDLGKELTPTQVKDEPSSVTWTHDDKIYYTVAMVDPDAPSRTEPTLREALHWLVGNVPGGNIKNGDCIAEYIGSGPPPDTGLHRYVFLVYQQSGKIEFKEKKINNRTREGRPNFSIRKFAGEYNLGQPIAGNFYLAQYDDYVPILHSQLK